MHAQGMGTDRLRRHALKVIEAWRVGPRGPRTHDDARSWRLISHPIPLSLSVPQASDQRPRGATAPMQRRRSAHEPGSGFADVLVPELWMRLDEAGQQSGALG
jgi:hypothetical protein